MKTRDKEIIDLVIYKVRGYYDGIDERLTDALKEILRRLDKPDHIPGVREKVELAEKPESEFEKWWSKQDKLRLTTVARYAAQDAWDYQQSQLDAAGERIKKLEAHICGEPTAKLQFPKETK